MRFLILVFMVFTGFSEPVLAGFVLEGQRTFQKAPNCNDVYAETCGRYGHVLHFGKSKPFKSVIPPGRVLRSEITGRGFVLEREKAVPESGYYDEK